MWSSSCVAEGLSSGFLRKQRFRKLVSSGLIPSGSGNAPASFTILIIAENWLRSKFGGLPLRSSKTVQPRDQISQAVVILSYISITSGAIQYGVPAKALLFLLLLLALSSSLVATPKSATFTTPSFVVNMFPPLMSLWMTFLPCKYSRPLNTCLMYTATIVSVKHPPCRFIRSSSEPHSTNSRTMASWRSFYTKSMYLTMLGWSSFFSSAIS